MMTSSKVDPRQPRSIPTEMKPEEIEKFRQEIFINPAKHAPQTGADDLSPEDIVRALSNPMFRSMFAKASGFSEDRIDSMLKVFQTMNKMDLKTSFMNYTPEQQQEAMKDMEQVMDLIKDDRVLPGTKIEEPDFSELMRMGKTSSSTSHKEAPKSSTSSSNDTRNLSKTPGNSTNDTEEEMRRKLEKILTPDELMDPKPKEIPREKLWNPAHLRTDKQEEEFTKEEVEELLKVYTDPDLGGLKQQAPESYAQAFGGENKSRAQWLGKSAQDLKMAELPILTADYHQLALENVRLREEVKRLETMLKNK